MPKAAVGQEREPYRKETHQARRSKLRRDSFIRRRRRKRTDATYPAVALPTKLYSFFYDALIVRKSKASTAHFATVTSYTGTKSPHRESYAPTIYPCSSPATYMLQCLYKEGDQTNKSADISVCVFFQSCVILFNKI